MILNYKVILLMMKNIKNKNFKNNFVGGVEQYGSIEILKF